MTVKQYDRDRAMARESHMTALMQVIADDVMHQDERD